MSTTLGGLIKDLRIQKNMSQLEIALALGWKEPSRLSRIEQGKIEHPPREALDSLMAAMNLHAEEKNNLYLAGSYLPTKKDIDEARVKLAPIVNTWPFPAAALDFSWRIIYTNQKLYSLYDCSPKDQQLIEDHTPNVIEMIFSPGFSGNQKNEFFYTRILAQFISAHKSRSSEHWYLDLVKRMMNNDLFRELWPKAQSYEPTDYDVSNFVSKTLKGFNFYSFIMPVFKDPRFTIEYYTPADTQTMEHFNK